MLHPPQIKPHALKPGDNIRLVSPSSPITPERAERGVKILQELGFNTSFGQHAFASDNYLAGTDEQRASDLMDAFLDPQVDCVFCTRGGYGAVRLLPYLDLDAMASSGKMFCGFSDITTLHIALNRRGLVTMHAPMLLSFSVDREDWVYKSFETLLTSTEPIGDSGKVGNTLVGGTAQGRVTGGCLCLLTDSLGTPESIDFEAKLVLIEDVDEDAHRIDAMLQHLVRSGQAESAAGFIVGEMTGTNDRCDPSIGACDWQEIAADILRPLGKPTIMNYPFGHQKGMLSLPLGIEAKLDADAGSLTFLEAACQ